MEQEDQAISIHDASGKVPVPCASLALLMLGPGVSITHAAISVLAEHGCLVAWCGEEGIRFYALGLGETRSATNLLYQANAWADKQLHLRVVQRLYQSRFREKLDSNLTLQQIRGMEGIRVRNAYAKAAQESGIRWSGRNYRQDNWDSADPVNRALSAANSCLYGICHAAIISAGFSPALGFIHTGKMLSFVYDIADLYKTEITVPIAFRGVAEGWDELERRVRLTCRDTFVSTNLLERIIPDICKVLGLEENKVSPDDEQMDEEPAAPGPLWDPEVGKTKGGVIQPQQLRLGDTNGSIDT